MSALKRNDSATQSAPPWPLTPKTNNKVIAPKVEQVEEVEAIIDLKPVVDEDNAVFIADTWPALAR